MKEKPSSLVSQRNLRIVGGVCLLVALIMAAYGPAMLRQTGHWALPLIYWAVFVVVLLAALYIALIDIRFTRLQYKLEERALFHDVFLTKELRQSMKTTETENEEALGQNTKRGPIP